MAKIVEKSGRKLSRFQCDESGWWRLMNDEFTKTDDAWAALRDEVPSSASRWRLRLRIGYDASIPYCNIHNLAEYIVDHVVRQRPEER